MFTQTVQARKFQKAARSVLIAKRREQDYTATVVIDPDMPLEFRTLGKDLVAKRLNAAIADKAVDGRYVDLVDPEGNKIKVFSRVIRKATNGALTASIGDTELSAINFATPGDVPDFIYFTVFNPVSRAVDVFRFAPKEDTGKYPPTLSVAWSERTQSYNSKEKNRVVTYLI